MNHQADNTPKPKGLQVAYVKLRGNRPGSRIGIVKFGESGYYLTDYDHVSYTDKQVAEYVSELNKGLGVPPEVAEAMGGSMFSWSAPIAQAARTFFATPEGPVQ